MIALRLEDSAIRVDNPQTDVMSDLCVHHKRLFCTTRGSPHPALPDHGVTRSG